jgi:hypothetical protein
LAELDEKIAAADDRIQVAFQAPGLISRVFHE